MTRTRDDHDFASFVQVGEKSYRYAKVDSLPSVTVSSLPSVTVSSLPNVTVDSLPNVTVDSMPDTVVSELPANVPDLFLEVSKGNIPGHTFIEKFGENPEIKTGTDPEDVWSGGGIYNFSSTADIDTVSSSDASDTSTLTIIGLDADWNKVTQQVTLNGQNKVTLTTPLLRIYRSYNDNGIEFIGTVYIYVDSDITGGVPDTDSTIRAVIAQDAQQSEMAIYSVPAGYTAFFLGGYVSCSRSGTAAAGFTWKARTFGGVFRVQSRIAVHSQGGGWQYRYPIPVALPEKSDIKITCEEVSATVGVAGGFSVLLIDNNYL